MTDKEELTRGEALARVAVLEAEIAELRQRVCVPEVVSYYERAHGKKSPTHGMSLDERIEHVGGRTNTAGYIEFDNVMAVSALIDHVLRDSPAPRSALTAVQDVAGLVEALELQEKFWAERESELGCLSPEAAVVRAAGQSAIAAHQQGKENTDG